MSIEEKAKAYDEALEKARVYRDNAKIAEEYSAVARYENIFPELRKEEKPLTPFQQCLNCILRGVYYAEVPDKKVNEFILNVVRTRTDELIKLAKRHEYTDCQFRENEDERIRKALIDALKVSETIGELKFRLPYPTREECIAYLEKQKEQKPAEWGEKHIADIFEKVGLAKIAREQGNDALTNALQDAMLELSKAWNTEWSEEDEDMLNSCISSIEEAKENRYAYKETDGDTSYDHEIAWLKSLRPSWKPSEEQMNELWSAISYIELPGSNYLGVPELLEFLYEQLKKL